MTYSKIITFALFSILPGMISASACSGATTTSGTSSGAGGTSSGTGGTSSGTGGNRFCPSVTDASYISLELLPIGENLEGTVFGHWVLVFSGANVCWGHDDVLRDDGMYTCEGTSLSMHFFGYDGLATYDEVTGRLRWAGSDYEPYTGQQLEVRYCDL